MPGHPDSTKLSELLLSSTHTGHTHMMTGFVSFGEGNCIRWILTFKSQNETRSPCEGLQTLQGKTDTGMSPCCGRPSNTGNWKPRLEGWVWIFFLNYMLQLSERCCWSWNGRQAVTAHYHSGHLWLRKSLKTSKTQTSARGLFCLKPNNFNIHIPSLIRFLA